MSSIEVMIMNASGPKQKGKTRRRKQVIQNVINLYLPDLVLFQEFPWKKIHGRTWPADPVPEYYQLTGNKDAGILYDINELTVEEIPIRKLKQILEELQGAKHKISRIPLDFAPIPRMCLRVVKTKGVPVMDFICISWHGRHSRMSHDRKVTEFRYLMIFVKKIYEKYDLPILIAGDFNVDMKLIQDKVEDPFELYNYKASKRRKKNVIDYFIATTELYLSDLEPVDLNKDSKADNPEEVLDHDPIIAMLEPDELSITDSSSNSTDSSCSEYCCH